MTEGLRSTTAVTDDEGDVDAYTYDVFGAVRSQSGSSSNYWLFTGEQWDVESGLYYLRARYYDPDIGRFLGRDPLTGSTLRPQTQNRYAYVKNNPATLVDPSGMCPRAEGGFVSPAYPSCRSPLGCWDVDRDALRALFSEYWECVSFGLAIAAAMMHNPWLAGAVVSIDAAGEIFLQGDVKGATGSTFVGGGAAVGKWEIKEQAKRFKPKYLRWDEIGVKGVGESLNWFALGFTGYGCAKRLGILKPMGINP
jgi:RHS repeat-associated protein